jgi:hypothetical protein
MGRTASTENYVIARETVKKKWIVMFLFDKVEVLGEFDRGISTAMYQHHYGINKPRILFIKKK